MSLPDNTKKYIVYYAPGMEDVAAGLKKKYPNSIFIFEIEWGKFADITNNIFIKDIEKVENRHVLFLGTFNGADEKLSQYDVLHVLTESFVRSLTILLPFFDTATMERVEKEGRIATANPASRSLSDLPLTAGGPAKIIVYDLHTLQQRFYTTGGAVIKMATAIPLFKKEIRGLKNIAIAFPDAGAHKRFGGMFKEYPTIVCGKIRKGDNRIVTIADGNPKGLHVYIVDDLVQSGNTLLKCKEVLLKAGATEVSAFVTHVIFPKESWKKITDDTSSTGFSTFYFTNTCPKMANKINGKGPFKMLSIVDNLSDYLLL